MRIIQAADLFCRAGDFSTGLLQAAHEMGVEAQMLGKSAKLGNVTRPLAA